MGQTDGKPIDVHIARHAYSDSRTMVGIITSNVKASVLQLCAKYARKNNPSGGPLTPHILNPKPP